MSLVERITQANESEKARLNDIQGRRRAELAPLEQRIQTLQQQISEP